MNCRLRGELPHCGRRTLRNHESLTIPSRPSACPHCRIPRHGRERAGGTGQCVIQCGNPPHVAAFWQALPAGSWARCSAPGRGRSGPVQPLPRRTLPSARKRSRPCKQHRPGPGSRVTSGADCCCRRRRAMTTRAASGTVPSIAGLPASWSAAGPPMWLPGCASQPRRD
jgi:hypothetical protein